MDSIELYCLDRTTQFKCPIQHDWFVFLFLPPISSISTQHTVNIDTLGPPVQVSANCHGDHPILQCLSLVSSNKLLFFGKCTVVWVVAKGMSGVVSKAKLCQKKHTKFFLPEKFSKQNIYLACDDNCISSKPSSLLKFILLY